MAPGGGLSGSKLGTGIGFVAGACFFLFGYDQGDLAGILTIPTFRNQFPEINTIDNPESLHTATIQGITVAAWNIGCFLSSMATIFWGDMVGRKKTIYCGLIFLMIGEIIQASSFSLGQLIAGRVIAGFGNGFNAATVPAWQAECTKAHRRGTMLMLSAGACIAAGISFSYWIDFGFAWADWTSASWRVPIALQLVFVLVTLTVLFFMPESPRWLILTGREDAALDVLSRLNEQERDGHETRQEFLQIKDAVIEMAKGSTGDVFSMTDYRHLHRVVLAFVAQVIQQMSGINLVTQYLALMFIQQFLYIRWHAMLIAACAGSFFFLASFVAVVGIDRFWGRRSLMLFGATGMCICMVLLSIMDYLNVNGSLIAGTVFIFAYLAFFAIGWQGMAWLYQVEIIPLRIRGPANALSTAANWLINFVVVLITPVAFHNIGYRTYIIFAVTNFVALPIVYFFYPETGYRSLEEIDVIFHAASLGPKPWLSVRKIAANEPLWYGKDGEEPFNYEESEWHQRHVRFSDEIKDSDGGSHTLQGSGSSYTSPPHKKVEGSSTDDTSTDNEKPPYNPELEAAPAPFVSRTSRDRASRDRGIRSAGRV
ncbi:sugar porter family MFS transporter [Hortaea werneckii]|nr:sugar porter family MFS transporter [Hortaea werneckii]KAI7326215.1 sugar porter family MFS transporter [Hortaea werneckii]